MTPVLVLVTVEDLEEAKKIASSLVEEKIAACCNISSPLTSVFEWQGKIETATEFKLFIKTFEEKWDVLSSRIKELHSYTVPEINMIRINRLNPGYLNWMHDVIHA